MSKLDYSGSHLRRLEKTILPTLYLIYPIIIDVKEQLISQIRHNIIKTNEGQFLQAGANQFQSFWTRDFCFASLGLSSVGEFEVVRNHLQYLLDHLRVEDGLAARIIESQWSGKTVVLNTVFRFLPYSWRKNSHNKKLKPEYLGEHGTLSIDSNALIIIASFQYIRKSNDEKFLEKNRSKLIKAFQFYQNRTNANLITQESFEDWQDSVKREGKTFYTNILYWYAGKLLNDAGLLDVDTKRIHQSIQSCFWSEDFYRSMELGSQNSLEGNYLAILFDFIPPEEQKALFETCEKHQNNFFPFCTQPKYPRQDVSWTTKVVGLRHYHDELHWSWILGLKLAAQRKLALKDQTYSLLEDLLQRDNTIYEVYSEDLKPFETKTYLSEHPFSWGIGIILWALYDI
ncbi:MAG: hypothetical protein CME65_07720 [Halobacteriovoraceae bacterium]|nr:hypothetical protein [Halobacteriovoraceae bacterium]